MAYSVMGEEKSPDLLLDQFRFPGTEDGAWSALVSFKLIEHKFRFPALMVRCGELGGRDFFRVSRIRNEGDDLLAVSLIRDLVIDGRTVSVDSAVPGLMMGPETVASMEPSGLSTTQATSTLSGALGARNG